MNGGLAKGLLMFVLALGFSFSGFIFTNGGEVHSSQQDQLDTIRDSMQADAVSRCIRLPKESERTRCLELLRVPKRDEGR